MAKLSFKVYLIYENSSEHLEVRRFGIDDDVATNYVYLREKLQLIFPQLRGWNFTITWRDEENESITISTNEELEIALSEISKNNSNIFKLYVVLGDAERGKDVDAKKIEQTLHPGVVCDVCDKNICGFRFKCMQCADYDLCSDCMTLGYHPEHYIVRMTEPIEWSSYHGRRLAHHMRKFMKKVNNDERRYKNGRRGGSGNSNSTGGCPIFNMSGKFADPFDASVIDSLADFIADACVPPSDEYAENTQKRSKEQRRDPSTEAATEATENLQQEASKDKFSHLMKIFENNLSSISQFLDPLGISITVTDDRDTPKNVAKEKAEAQKPAESVNETVKKFPGKGKKLCDDSADEKTVPSEEVISQKEASCSAEQAAEAEEWTMVQRESTNNSCASSISSSLNGSVTPTAEPVKSEPSKQSIYPSLPQEGKHEFYHPNPKIQDAVEAMMAMGFSNEGGWLTHLLVSKDGDISQALDVLQPVRHH